MVASRLHVSYLHLMCLASYMVANSPHVCAHHILSIYWYIKYDLKLIPWFGSLPLGLLLFVLMFSCFCDAALLLTYVCVIPSCWGWWSFLSCATRIMRSKITCIHEDYLPPCESICHDDDGLPPCESICHDDDGLPPCESICHDGILTCIHMPRWWRLATM